MNSERFERVREIYHAALDHPPEQRPELVAQMCSGDTALQQEIQSLLMAEAEASGKFMATSDGAISDPRLFQAAGGALSGRILGYYEVLSPVGIGGMGEVYLATIRDWTEM